MVLQDDGPGYRESCTFAAGRWSCSSTPPDRLAGFLASELAERKPSTHRMLAYGVPVLGDSGDLPARCARVPAQGPPPFTDADRDRFRYALIDLLDDYSPVVDAGEWSVIAAALWIDAGRAALAFAGRWISGGKRLLRELRKFDPAFAARGLAARDDPAKLTTQVLARPAARCSTATDSGAVLAPCRFAPGASRQLMRRGPRGTAEARHPPGTADTRQHRRCDIRNGGNPSGVHLSRAGEASTP